MSPLRTAGLGLVLYAVFPILSAALAHTAPMGWDYDLSCCSNTDCQQLTFEQTSQMIKPLPNGDWLVVPSNTVIGKSNGTQFKLKRSKDEFFHLCTLGGVVTAYVYCLYVPDMGN